MIQASLIGFAVGGAFLSLLYFDVPYYLMAAVVAIRILVEQRRAELAASRPVKPARGSLRPAATKTTAETKAETKAETNAGAAP